MSKQALMAKGSHIDRFPKTVINAIYDAVRCEIQFSSCSHFVQVTSIFMYNIG